MGQERYQNRYPNSKIAFRSAGVYLRKNDDGRILDIWFLRVQPLPSFSALLKTPLQGAGARFLSNAIKIDLSPCKHSSCEMAFDSYP
jgi:hypothetical protein